MSRKPSKPETRIEDYLDVMTGGNAVLPQPILRIEFYYAFLARMAVELPQPILDDEKLLAKICGMEVEAPTYIPGLFPRLYAYMAKKGGQDVQVPDPILRLERYWYDYSAGETPPVQEYTGAVPVTFIADGTPLLDYIISGNTVQSGTPTPDNPIMPQGTGELETNLAIISGDSKTIENRYYTNVRISDVLEAGTYTISYVIDEKTGDASTSTVGFGTRYAYQKDFESFTVRNVPTTITVTVTLDSEGCLWARFLRSGSQTDFSYSVSHVRVEKGTHSYGYKLTISSASTTTPVYLGEVETTRKINKLVLTGEEANWYYYENAAGTVKFFYLVIVRINGVNLNNLLNTHGFNATEVTQQSGNTLIRIYAVSEGMETIEEWKTYLAAQYANGTPVTVWYVLATEETAVVNEPLMKIGDYADTLSMEQAGVSIPTASGSTTLDVETTVKPSEVYIKYRGEAVGTLSALPAEVSSSEEIPENANPEEMEETENER